jgi:hypothetical protein
VCNSSSEYKGIKDYCPTRFTAAVEQVKPAIEVPEEK